MSTKTTLKRIALFAVSALGFGLLSVVPAKAASYTSAATLGWSAMTVVGSSEGTGNTGYFYVDTTEYTDGASAASTAEPLQSSGESMTVTVVSAPSASRAVSDLIIVPMTSPATVAGAFTEVTDGVANDESVQIPEGSATVASYRSGNYSYSATESLNNEYNRYWFGVYPKSSGNAIGAGKYTIRVRVYSASGSTIETTLTVKFVSEIADAGAVLTTAKTGSISTGVAYAYTSNTNVTATLRDADGGRIQMGQTLASGTKNAWAPTLTASLWNETDTTASDEDLSIADTGYTARDHNECGTGGAAACGADATASTWAVAVTNALSNNLTAVLDGKYGVYDSDISTTADLAAFVRFKVSNTNVSKDQAIAVVATANATSAGTTTLVSATGMHPDNDLVRTPTCTSGACTITYKLPLTAKSATVTFNTDATTAGQALLSTVTWTGNYASADVSPATTTATTLYTNSAFKVSQAITNNAPVAGTTATVKLTGFATAGHSVSVVFTWGAPVITTATVTDPLDGVYVKTGSTTTFTILAKDQFGNPVSGEQFRPSLGTDSANYSATTTYAPVTTNASGVATWSITDALAVADDEENVTFTSITDGTIAPAIDITYKATLPTISTINSYFSQTFATLDTTIATAVPASGIANAGVPVAIKMGRNQSYSLASNGDTDTNDMVAIRIRATTSAGAAATGASVTLTAPAGGHVLNSSGLPAASRTKAVDASGDAYFQIMATAPGALSFAVSSGSTSLGTIVLNVAAQDYANARFVTLTGAASGTANGEGVPMTALVTDRFGNGVKNVTFSVTASGVGSFMGGATSQSFTTDSTGKFTFLATSTVAAGGSATFSVNASASNSTDMTSVAGYFGATAIDSSVKAGNSSATATITFAAGANGAQAAAEAATDAAAEAIDAANAATDAANLAAEAADAATVAAEEARDAADAATAAVEELATQVASLMAALKAQITTLANTVAKIAKKVKA